MARVEMFARTEVGNVRERNEDNFLVVNLGMQASSGLQADQRSREIDARGTLIAVCDGMGGAAAGDVASELAVEQLRATMESSSPFQDANEAQAALIQAHANANRAIAAYAKANPTRQGMGTTMTAAIIFNREIHVGHIGDSRAYLVRGRSIKQMTTDHSVVGQMIASGQLTPQQAREFEHRNVLLQALGVQQVISPEICVAELRGGDMLLVCSDGLTGPLTDEQVLQIMLRYQDPVRACRALTEAACAAGGPDNVTVAVARFLGEDLPAPRGREPIEIRRASYTVE